MEIIPAVTRLGVLVLQLLLNGWLKWQRTCVMWNETHAVISCGASTASVNLAKAHSQLCQPNNGCLKAQQLTILKATQTPHVNQACLPSLQRQLFFPKRNRELETREVSVCAKSVSAQQVLFWVFQFVVFGGSRFFVCLLACLRWGESKQGFSV